MTITGIISAILIGVVVGVLGRLVVPGKQRIGMLLTILVGIVAAFLGTALARAMGIPFRAGTSVLLVGLDFAQCTSASLLVFARYAESEIRAPAPYPWRLGSTVAASLHWSLADGFLESALSRALPKRWACPLAGSHSVLAQNALRLAP